MGLQEDWRGETALEPMLADDRRRRNEAKLAATADEMVGALLPLALALARLAARRDALNGVRQD